MTENRFSTSLIPCLAALVLFSLTIFAVSWGEPIDPVRIWNGPHLPASTIAKVLVFALTLAASALVCVRLLRTAWPFLLVPLAIVVVSGHSDALTAMVLQAMASLALGIPLWRWVRGPNATNDTSLFGVIIASYTGISINAYIVWIALHGRVNYDFVYFGFLMAEILLFHRPLTEVLTTLARKAKSYRFSPGQWGIVLGATILLPCALTPLILYDDAARHLFFPKQIAMFGMHVFDPSYVWTVDTEVFSQGCFAVSYLLGGEYAVRLLNFSAAFVAMLLIEDFCRRRFGATTALWTALTLVSMPIMGTAVSAVYLETLNFLSVAVLMVVTFQLLPFIVLRRAVCFFILAAFAYLYKQQAVFLAVPLAVGVAASLISQSIKRRSSLPIVSLAVGTLAGIVVVSPFLGQNYILTGNPFFPWLNGMFHSDWFDPNNFEGIRFDQNLGFGSLWALTFHGERFAEAGRFQFGISFFVLAGFVPLVLVRGRNLPIKWMLACLFLVSVVMWWIITSPNLRYFVGPLVPGAILIGLAVNELWELVRVDRLAKTVAGAALAVVLMANVTCLLFGTERLRPYPLVETFSKQHNSVTSHIGVVQNIKKVFSVAAAKYGKESLCLLVDSPYLYLADQHVMWLHGICYRNWQDFQQCKNEDDAFDWIFRKQQCACIIVTDNAPVSLLTSARFRELVQVDFSTGGYTLLVPKAEVLECRNRQASQAANPGMPPG